MDSKYTINKYGNKYYKYPKPVIQTFVLILKITAHARNIAIITFRMLKNERKEST